MRKIDDIRSQVRNKMGKRLTQEDIDEIESIILETEKIGRKKLIREFLQSRPGRDRRKVGVKNRGITPILRKVQELTRELDPEDLVDD